MGGRTASERELARLSDSFAAGAAGATTVKPKKPPPPPLVKVKRLINPKKEADRASKDVANLLQWLQSAARNVHRAGIYAARAKGVLDVRSVMIHRWRESWHDGSRVGGGGVGGGGGGGEGRGEGVGEGVSDGKARKEAREAGRQKLEAVSAIYRRPFKHPQGPHADVAFSSDDDEA